MSNIHVENNFFGSGIAVGYEPVQLPNIPVLNNLILINHSGSQNTIYIGNSGLNWTCAAPLFVEAGVVVAVQNTNMVWAVMESGYSGNLRYLLS